MRKKRQRLELIIEIVFTSGFLCTGLSVLKKLIIDGVCENDEFCDQIRREGNLGRQLIGIINNMSQVANMKRLPQEKFKDITARNDTIKEFELKKGDLRIYLIKEEGHILILGGKKSSQHGDIKHFRSVNRRYIESKK